MPELKVLFTTGYTRNAIVHRGRLDAGVHMIGKPYSFNDLASKLRSLLDVQASEFLKQRPAARHPRTIHREEAACRMDCYNPLILRRLFPSTPPRRLDE